MKWVEVDGILGIQARLSISGDYVISHRPKNFTACWRPDGRHVHLASFPTLEEATDAVEKWEAAGRPIDASLSTGMVEFAAGFPRWWNPGKVTHLAGRKGP